MNSCFGQVLVVCFTVFAGLMAFNYHRVLQVWAIPLLLVAFFAYLVAHSFLSVFETVLDALFLCFAIDLETNDGSSEKPYFMDQEFLVSKHLISFFNLHPHTLKSVEDLYIKEAGPQLIFSSWWAGSVSLMSQDPNVLRVRFVFYFLRLIPPPLLKPSSWRKVKLNNEHLANDPG